MNPVRPEHRAQDRCGTQTEQDPVRAAYRRKGPIGIVSGPATKPIMEEERLGDEQEECENGPNKDHGGHPPEMRVEKAVPGLESIGHVEAAEAGHSDGEFGLSREAPFDL